MTEMAVMVSGGLRGGFELGTALSQAPALGLGKWRVLLVTSLWPVAAVLDHAVSDTRDLGHHMS